MLKLPYSGLSKCICKTPNTEQRYRFQIDQMLNMPTASIKGAFVHKKRRTHI